MTIETSDQEAARLEALRQYKILDTSAERVYDDIAILASVISDVPIALVSFIDAERQWFKAKVGLEMTETARDISFCTHTILDTTMMIVTDACCDERFATNPLVTSSPKIRFYAGIPLLTPQGHALGTLCVIDRQPRELSETQKNAFIQGDTMLRKVIDPNLLNTSQFQAGVIDVANSATVLVTSEDPSHPIENAFDHHQGAGANYWAAAAPGKQTIILVFDRPQHIRNIQLEIEETDVNRSQVLQLLASRDGGQTFNQVIQQDYNFSPSGATFQREVWAVNLEHITHLRLDITPDRDQELAAAKLTSLTLSS